MKRKLKNKRGITLIALAITIIVLLILAGVSIAMITRSKRTAISGRRSKNSNRRGSKQRTRRPRRIIKIYGGI